MSETETFDCVECGNTFNDDEGIGTDVGTMCEPCHDDAYGMCEDCQETTPQDDLESVDRGSRFVCSDCRGNYFKCANCEEMQHGDESNYTLHDESVCDSCIENSYGYCEDCDGYYHYDCDYDHQHDQDCDCEAREQRFAIRNGTDLLRNDEIVDFTLPSGFISDEGIGSIARVLRNAAPRPSSDDTDIRAAEYETWMKWRNLSHSLADIGNEWQGKRGNFTKRLSSHAYKQYGLKVSSTMLTEIGNIARAHSNGAEVKVSITRDLNQPAEDFAHEDSCWWTDYSASRCALKTNGGFGLRSFNTDETNEYAYQFGPWAHGLVNYWSPTGRMVKREYVSGRAWVMPMMSEDGRLRPTLETEEPDAYVVFNGYGDLEGYTGARIISGMVGMTYRKISFSSSPMYVNSDSGYLVSSEEIIESNAGGVRLYLDQHANLTREPARV